MPLGIITAAQRAGEFPNLIQQMPKKLHKFISTEKSKPIRKTDGLVLLSTPKNIFTELNTQTQVNLLAFGTALDQSCHAGFAAGEVGLAAATFDNLVVLLTHNEPTFSFVYVLFLRLFT